MMARSETAGEVALVGIVVIGRNEGRRLIDCLRSVGDHLGAAVYVDSGSTDGSTHAAERLGASVVALDMDFPFTAGRARNAGFERLLALHPHLSFVQFIDGDCLLDENWIDTARAFLENQPEVAIACGRRRERFPEKSIYNAMCDEEWSSPIGQALECGGDFLARVDSFRSVGGFTPDLIAGEEPELCVRLREKGWAIWRLDAEMTRHDANMTRFRQWWSRSMRAGHAFAEVADRHRRSPFGIWGRNVTRTVVWGAVPAPIALGGLFIHPVMLVGLLLYPIQVVRLALRGGGHHKGNWTYAAFSVLGKFPEFQGVAKFYANRLLKRRQAIIEYK